jgi:hypothetical protein
LAIARLLHDVLPEDDVDLVDDEEAKDGDFTPDEAGP